MTVVARALANMVPLRAEPHRGTLYRCGCGWQGWSTFGNAHRHANRCQAPPVCGECGGRLVRQLRLDGEHGLFCLACQAPR